VVEKNMAVVTEAEANTQARQRQRDQKKTLQKTLMWLKQQ